MSNFGIPYMGSKSKICASIALNFPKADHFYDLFGGGFSISHYMLANKAKNYKHFYYNEIKTHITDIVTKAIAGEFNYDVFKPPWISRAEFHAKKYTDGYVASCWSFGNNQETYLFGEDIEEYKRSMHMAIVFGEFDEIAQKTLKFTKWPAIAKTITQRRSYLGQLIEHYRKTNIPIHLHRYLSDEQRAKVTQKPFKVLEQLERLQRLQRLEQLEQLRQLERLTITSLDYRNVKILPNSIIYCDIPYAGTADYGNEFSHKDFFDWAATQTCPVFISEYALPDKRFELVYSVDKRVMLTTTGNPNKIKQEKLFWNGIATK